MNLNNISCINCRENLKNFKNIIIHYIMHKNICPFCLAYYRSYKQFYDVNGHFNTKKCKNEQNKIITNNQKRDSFYKKLMDITGEKIKYPTNDPDDPCKHLCNQNQDEIFYQENNENNQTIDNEENHDIIGLVHSEDENNEIRIDENEANINNENNENNENENAQNEPINNNLNNNLDNEKSKKKLNETEIEFLMLGIENSISLKLLEKFKSFIDKNKTNLNQIRYTPQYMDKLFMEDFQIKGETFINKNYDHSIFYFEIKKVLETLLNKKQFFERIDFDTDFETGIYTNYKSGQQFKDLKNKNKNIIVLLRIFTDIPNDWLLNFHQTIMALFSSFIGNGFNLIIENEQIDVVPFGLTMDIPEFRASCKLNGHNSNEYACHTCDQPRDGLFICKSGTLRKQEDITNFHSTKPNYAELNADIELKKTYYLLISIKNQISNNDFLIMEQLVTICFKLYSDSFDENDLNSLQVLIESFNAKVNLITETEIMNFHLLLHYPIYIKNWGAPKYTSAETFEAQLSRIKNYLNNNTNNRDEQYERVIKLYMVKFFNSVDKLKSIEPESTALIIEIYNVGDAVEFASDNELSGRWSGIINSISMIEMDDNIIKHAILLNYFDKYVGDQFNKYHFLSNELNYITYDNILNNVSNFFITGIIKQAGGSNEDCTSQNIFARTKVADSLAIYSKGEKNHNLKVYISDSQVFFGNEIFSPALLSLFLSHINYENYQNDIFIKEFVDSCKTGEEKHWYPDSVPLIKRLISILNDFSSKFDSKAKMRKDAQEAFQFPNSHYKVNFKGHFKGNFKGHFKGNFKGHFKGNFQGHFKVNFKEHYKGNFKGHFKGNFQGHFKVNFKGNFKGDFKGDFKGHLKNCF
ncbi:hypothetical protein ACTFIT_003306 [Dictyostelium discoideum]